MNKIDKILAGLVKNREKDQITNIGNGKGDFIRNHAGIRKVIRGYNLEPYSN